MNTKKKQSLLILSDLWGVENSNWITYYITILKKDFDIKYYDSHDLAEISKKEFTEKELHARYIRGGVEKAVNNLLIKEKKNSIILGFSIGGYIAWKACIAGLNSEKLIAVSSTRLRYETQKPSVNIELIYGERDIYKPTTSWFGLRNLTPKIYKDSEHDLYKKKEIAESICELITQPHLK